MINRLISFKYGLFPMILLVAACGSEEQPVAEPKNVEEPPVVEQFDQASQNEEQVRELRQEIEQLQKSITEFKHEHAELAIELEVASDMLIQSENTLQQQKTDVNQLEAAP